MSYIHHHDTKYVKSTCVLWLIYFLLFPNPNKPESTPFFETTGTISLDLSFAEMVSITSNRRSVGSVCTVTSPSFEKVFNGIAILECKGSMTGTRDIPEAAST